MENIDVVILVGGSGSRLREVISHCPKPMAEIKERPFLDILIDYVSCYNLNRFIFCTGYMSDIIKEYYKDNKQNGEIIISNEDFPLGTAGAVKNAERFIRGNTFLVMNGDSFCPADLQGFLDFHRKKEAYISMVLVATENTGDIGVITIDDTQRILNFDEKASDNSGVVFINAGIYLFERNILSLIPHNKQYSLEYDLFPKLIKERFYGYFIHEQMIDIGTPKRYEYAKNTLFL